MQSEQHDASEKTKADPRKSRKKILRLIAADLAKQDYADKAADDDSRQYRCTKSEGDDAVEKIGQQFELERPNNCV